MLHNTNITVMPSIFYIQALSWTCFVSMIWKKKKKETAATLSLNPNHMFPSPCSPLFIHLCFSPQICWILVLQRHLLLSCFGLIKISVNLVSTNSTMIFPVASRSVKISPHKAAAAAFIVLFGLKFPYYTCSPAGWRNATAGALPLM